MLHHEYYVVLRTLIQLQVKQVNTFIECGDLTGNLGGQIVEVSRYFNKRYYKFHKQGFANREDEIPHLMD